MNAIEYAGGLRLLADWYEQHADVELPSSVVTVYAEDTKENAALILRSLSPCEKTYADDLFHLKRKFGPLLLDFVFLRNTVCVPRIVGQREVPASVTPAQFVPEKFVEAHTEDIIERDCKPVLGAAQQEIAPAAEPTVEIPF